MNYCDFDKASNDFSSGKNKNFAKNPLQIKIKVI